MRNSEYYAAVYGILENEHGEILLMQRQNTWFMDGKYGLPAWHLEWYETLKQWVIREVKEEIWIDIAEVNLKMIHSWHRVTKWERVYFDFYFKIEDFSWEIVNGEPDKCSKIEFLKKDDERIIPYLREIFQKIEENEAFSETILISKHINYGKTNNV